MYLQHKSDNNALSTSLRTDFFINYISYQVTRNAYFGNTDNILIRSNKMQQYAGIYLLQNHSTCFGRPSHPSSGVHKTVTADSGTGHSI